MPRQKSRSIFGIVTIVTIMAIFMMTGCSKSPVKSSLDNQPSPLRRMPVVTDANMSPVNLYTDSVISSSVGGVMTLLDVTLDIPAGAVPNDTLFSIAIPDDEIFFNDFGTSGLVFDKPVTVTMSYRGADMSGINESTVRIAWLNESTNTYWDIPCTVDFVNKTVTAQLHHFSAYGLISD